MKQGLVFDISHYMLEDGPGIRTNVFMKGCPLRCQWCSNAYGLTSQMQMAFFPAHCTSCGMCVKVCPTGALSRDLSTGSILTDYEKCKNCLHCVKVCNTNARQTIGKLYTADEIVKEVEKDRMYYRRSGGGVTMSGGEILMQAEFVAEVLKKCTHAGIHTAIETSAYGSWSHLKQLLQYADTVFIDCKHMDSQRHLEYTGMGNGLILNNIVLAATECSRLGNKLIIRLPLIPGINDQEDNLIATATFVKSLLGEPLLNILPYHNYGVGKYEAIGREYLLKDIKPQEAKDLQRVKRILDAQNVKYSIGGYDI